MGNDVIMHRFNNMMEEFIIKMINAFPCEPKLKTYYNAFKFSRMYSKILPLQIFMGGCLDFKEAIGKRDSNFFLNREGFMDKCRRASSFSNDVGLKDLWDDTSEEIQGFIWDYIQTLFVLGELFIQDNKDSEDVINRVYDFMSLNELSRFKDGSPEGGFSVDFINRMKSN